MGYMVKAFTIINRVCIQWGRDVEVGREPVQVYTGHEMILVSRIRHGNSVIIGKLGTTRFLANFEGQSFEAVSTDYNIEVLTIDDACTWSWLTYTSGEVLPVGAVIGGHLNSGSPIYVAKMHNGLVEPAFGYYSTDNSLGNYELYGAQTASTMDILVIL